MAKVDTHTLTRTMFGDQFDFLADALADDDPVMRAKALMTLRVYISDCMEPLELLQNAVQHAASKAVKKTRAAKGNKLSIDAANGVPDMEKFLRDRANKAKQEPHLPNSAKFVHRST